MVGLAAVEKTQFRKFIGRGGGDVGASTARQALLAGFANAIVAGPFLLSPSSATAQAMPVERCFPIVRNVRSGGLDHRDNSSSVFTETASELTLGVGLSIYGHLPTPVRATITGRSSVGPSLTMSDDTNAVLPAVPAVARRLQELSDILAEEGVQLSAVSSQHLLSFLQRHRVSVRPSLVGLETGAVRALWKNAEKEQVAIHFFENGRGNYVLFHQQDGKMQRAFGNASIAEIETEISDRNLWRLLIA